MILPDHQDDPECAKVDTQISTKIGAGDCTRRILEPPVSRASRTAFGSLCTTKSRIKSVNPWSLTVNITHIQPGQRIGDSAKCGFLGTTSHTAVPIQRVHSCPQICSITKSGGTCADLPWRPRAEARSFVFERSSETIPAHFKPDSSYQCVLRIN